MSSVQSETAGYAPKQEIVAHRQQKNQSIKMGTEMMELDTKVLKSYYSYKYFKYIYIIIIRRGMEDIKKNQVELLKWKRDYVKWEFY